MGLDGLLRARADVLSGILNGIDTDGLEPGHRPAARRRATTAPRWTGAPRNKAALQARFGLAAEPDAPLFGVVSRLTWQKGIDLLLAGAAGAARHAAAQLAAARHRRGGARGRLPRRRRGRIRGGSAASSAMTRRWRTCIQAGADALLVPSRFEPCGLTQLCALRYGAVPVVARVGGLADTVIDANDDGAGGRRRHRRAVRPGHAREMLEVALLRTAALYRATSALWRALQRNGMAPTSPGAARRARYAALYPRLVRRRDRMHA